MKTFIIKNKKSLLSIGFWFLIWDLVARIINNKILLPKPFNVIKTLLELIKERYFWQSIFNSFLKINFGFILGVSLGIILGIIVYRNNYLTEIINLPINFIQTVPLAALVVILLIWFNTPKLPIIIVLFIVLPNIYFTTINSLTRIDKKLLDMAKIFDVNKKNTIKFIYLPELTNTLLTSITVSTGLAWKSGISAEVFGLVKNSIGENIYYSKLYLATEELFAWIIVIMIVSNLFFKVFEKIVNRVKYSG